MPGDDFCLSASNHPQQAEALAASPFATWRQSEVCWHCLHDTLRAKQHGRIIDAPRTETSDAQKPIATDRKG